MKYEDVIYERCVAAIAGFDQVMAADVYALGLSYGTFWSADEQGVEVTYQSAVWFHYNSLTNWLRNIESTSDQLEAKWNLGFWESEIQYIAPRAVEYGYEPDVNEFALRDTWCASMGIMPRGHEDKGRLLYDEHELNRAIVAMCQRVVQRLHQNEVIVKYFGRHIPVIICDDEDGVAVQATLAANPASNDLKEVCECMLKWHGNLNL